MPAYRSGFALPLDELRDEIDRLWTSLVTAPPLHGWGSAQGQRQFPAVNVRETDEAITVEAELPGLDASAVDVSVSGEELVLKGSRPAPADVSPSAAACDEGGSCVETTAERPTGHRVERETGVVWHLRERGSGTFERRIELPVPVDAGRVEARLVDGVLTVTCPKLAECQPRKVQVRAT